MLVVISAGHACGAEIESFEPKAEVVLPTVLREFGYRFHFYSNEGDEPPHIHITGKGGEMKI